jgi:UDPglucose--hexose-1-phosphate uridylyltransferase
VGTLDELDNEQRDACAAALIDALTHMQQLFSPTIPYMLWVNQRPTTNQPEHENAWLNIEIVSPWRANNVLRYIAAAEVSTSEYFNPLIPEELARSLRDVRASQ